MNLHDWIDELCDVLDVSTEVDEGLVNDLVTVVGKAVQPTAGPVTAYLLGYAASRVGGDPEQVEQLAARAQELAENWDRPPDAGDDDDDEVESLIGDDTEVEVLEDEDEFAR